MSEDPTTLLSQVMVGIAAGNHDDIRSLRNGAARVLAQRERQNEQLRSLVTTLDDVLAGKSS